MRRMCRARCEIDKEWLVRNKRLLLADPADGLVGHVRHEVVALFRRRFRLDGCCAFVDRGIPLVRFAADKSVKIFEASAACRPGIERPRTARLPHRHLVTLAELRGRISVQLQRLGDRRGRVGQHRRISRRTGGDFGDTAHADGMMVAAGEKRLTCRRA